MKLLGSEVDAERQASLLSRLMRNPQRSWMFHRGPVYELGKRLSFAVGSVRSKYLWQRALVACSRGLNLAGRDNMLLVSSARSGTTLMVDYLNCHPRIRCRGEILNADYGCYGNPKQMDNARLKLHVKSFFVKRPGRMAGAKILTNQLDELRINLTDLIDVLHRPRIILLYRQHTLEQYVSLHLAAHTGVWHSNKAANAGPIWLDPQVFIKYAERERRMWQETLTALRGSNFHVLTYEHLSRHANQAMRDVFHFLGLKPCPIESFVRKLHDRPLSEKLANYKQFADAGLVSTSVLDLPNSLAA